MPKRVIETPLTARTEDGDILGAVEEEFCQLYVLYKGNGTKAEFEAGNHKTRNSAGVIANERLRNPKILKRIKELVPKHIMTPSEADFELTKVIRQDSELTAKNKGLEIYNRLLGRYEKDNEQKKTEVNVYNWGNYEEENDNNIQAESVD